MKNIKRYYVYLLILILCIFAYILTLIRIFPDGGNGCINNKCGFIIGANYWDGMWFMSVAATAFKTFPFQMPVFSGANLQGYYFLPALITYIISLSGLSIFTICYKIFPVVYLLVLTYFSIRLGLRMTNDWRYVFLLLFFVLLGIPMTLLPSIIHGVPIYNDLLIKTFQATNIFDSPPTAYSYLLFFPALFIIHGKFFGKRQIAILGVILFLLFGTKFYTAFLLMNILFIWRFIGMLRKNISWKNFVLELFFYGGMITASLVIFLNPLATIKNGPMFVFSPFASVHHLIEEPGLFFSNNLSLARYFLYEKGWSPRLLLIEFYSTFLFFAFYFGARIIGIFYLLWRYISKKASDIEIAVGIAIAISMFMSIMFVQRGDWFNPIQFAVGVAHLLSIYAALSIFLLYKNKFKTISSALFIVSCILIIPSNMVNLDYLNSAQRRMISTDEMKGLMYLKKRENGSVYIPSFESDSPYIPVFTGKTTYINYLHQLDNFGIPYQNRLKQVENPQSIDVNILSIKYAYIPKRYVYAVILINAFNKSPMYKIVFEDVDVIIFEKNDK